jgi:hypothetical protein
LYDTGGLNLPDERTKEEVAQALHFGEDENNLDSGAVQRSVYIIIS